MPDRSSHSIRDRTRSAALVALAVTVGVVGWRGTVLALPVAMLFPTLWAVAPSRVVAVLISLGYFLAASRGLPQGVANFYAADLWPGLLLWLVASLAFVVVHAALWTPRPGLARAMRYLLVTVLMAIPPFGITGWAQPITAAGVLFPGWGWWGLAATVAGLATMTSRFWLAAVLVMLSLWLWSAAFWTEPTLPEGWKGVDLEFGETLGRDASLERQRVLIATVVRSSSEGVRTVVLPESALGFWTPTVERLWRDALQGRDLTVVAGGAVLDGNGYDNVLLEISANKADILYRERMPVPGSMWQPWRMLTGEPGSARAHLFANSVVEIVGTRIAPLICYEQLIVWPILQSMLRSPKIIVAAGNGWWTTGTSIVAIQHASTVAWAKLFGLPLVSAINVQAKGE